MRQRKGCIYSEFTNKGRRSVRYFKGCAPVYCFRWVGEICIRRKRYRFRSTSRHNVEMWLADMINKQDSL